MTFPNGTIGEALYHCIAEAGIRMAKERKEKRRQSKMKDYGRYHPQTVAHFSNLNHE